MSVPPSTRAPEEATDLTGRMAGEYRIGHKLGEGGFGAVYEAEHPVLRRRAAVKVLHRVADRDSEAVLRFVSEAQAVNQVRTRHIVDIFSFGKLADGRHFYVMDLLDGEPLDRFLVRNGPLEPALALQILRPIGEALDKAHAAGIVHRDLKPQNVFLSWDASGQTVPVLLDFGVAKLMDASPVRTASGTPIGTPLYMSPEQARGDKVDGRTDVYALGVLCHELITGRPPITADTTVGVLMAHIVEEPPRASACRSTLPREIDVPILRMLAKAPAERPGSASEALEAVRLAAVEAGLAMPDGLPTLPRPTLPPRTPMPAFVGADGPTERAPEAEGASPHVLRESSRHAAPPRANNAPFWLATLLALGAVAAYFALREPPAEALPEPAAPVAPAVIAQPAEAPTLAAPDAARPAPSVDPEPHAPAPELPGGRRPAPAKTKRKPSVPSDLENPF